MTARPTSSHEGIEVELSTEHDQRVVIVAGPIEKAAGRPDLQAGEIALYCEPGGQSIILHADGSIQIGGPSATLAVARATDPVGPSEAMAAWGLLVENLINGLLPGSFTPMNSFAGTVQASFATITSGSGVASCQ